MVARRRRRLIRELGLLLRLTRRHLRRAVALPVALRRQVVRRRLDGAAAGVTAVVPIAGVGVAVARVVARAGVGVLARDAVATLRRAVAVPPAFWNRSRVGARGAATGRRRETPASVDFGVVAGAVVAVVPFVPLSTDAGSPPPSVPVSSLWAMPGTEMPTAPSASCATCCTGSGSAPCVARPRCQWWQPGRAW